MDVSADLPVLRASALTKIYPSPSAEAAPIGLFQGLELRVAQGELAAIVGRSGAGKSTLLHLLAGLDKPTSGEVWCGEVNVTALSADAAAAFRNRAIGYVWQTHYLLPEFTAAENVAMPLLSRGVARSVALREASNWLARVELRGREAHRSGELSGGEQQRVSLARALITQPQVLLADEPTGDLDDATAAQVFALLAQLHAEQHLAVVLVTHNMDLAARADRTLRLTNGQLVAA